MDTGRIMPGWQLSARRVLPSFPGDPADRVVCVTAAKHGWRAVTKDHRRRRLWHPGR